MARPATSHWSNALIAELSNPAKHLISNDQLIALRDKYPKARHHYLILPRADIPSIYHLNATHLPLLSDIALLAANCIELSDRPASEFRLGYHAEPSMQRLHLHCISTDLDSPALKTKQHWNSFTTPHFMPMEAVHRQVAETGAVRRPTAEECRQWAATALQCHRCAYRPKSMPDLKAHIVRPH